MNAFSPKNDARRGQALVEFSLAIMIFLAMLMGIFDLGRAIFAYNGVSEAAATSPGGPPCIRTTASPKGLEISDRRPRFATRSTRS